MRHLRSRDACRIVRSLRRFLSPIVCSGLIGVFLLALPLPACRLHADEAHRLWDRSNLVAWCIVPFDSEKRTPAQRVAMLKDLGLQRFAYDHRPEHLPTFEEELRLLKENGIELTAVWFPTQMNDTARLILDLLEKNQIRTQLWVMGGGDLTMTAEEEPKFIAAEVERLRPIAEAAQRIQCQVALYNHGKWFGEPENQLKIIQQLKMPNVGIVYNLHHAHHQLDRLDAILKAILPHALAINLNGMRTQGDRIGHKILPIGEGDRDLEVLRAIEQSGYKGPIGILNHTDEDARGRLQDNLRGLEWMIQRLQGKEPGEKPQWQTYDGSAAFAPALPKQIAAIAAQEGSAEAGLRWFTSASTACFSCHAIGGQGGKIGPDLSQIGMKRTADHLVTSLLWPNHEVEAAYQTYQVLLNDGRVIRGYRVEVTADGYTLRDPATGIETAISREDVESERSTGSLMPETLVSALPYAQQLDLIRFVSSLGRKDGMAPDVVASVLQHSGSHRASDFPYESGPIDPASRPWHKLSINRNRVYDFYAKQAEYFRTIDRVSTLFSPYPGLDGKGFGHWGNQDDTFWAGDEWNRVHLGNVHANIFKNGNQVITRAVCVRLDENGPAAAVFNADSLQFEAFWRGDFLTFSAVRHGILDGARPAGQLEAPPSPVTHKGPTEYRGYYRFGDQVVFSYLVGGEEFLDSLEIREGKPIRTCLPADQHPLRACKMGKPSVDAGDLETRIRLGSEVPFAIDTIELPIANRWAIPFFGGDLDFDRDGTLYLATHHGDVWRVTGIQGTESTKAVWRRFASGLHQAQGLVVRDGKCYVLGRNQITRLHDLNEDGHADWYECFSNKMISSPAGHDFICGLQCDEAGNFYTASGNQGLLKIRGDGKEVTVLATGFRNPDGLGLLPDGSLTVPCSEGDWTPTSMICLRTPKQAGVPFFGHRGPTVGGRPELPALYLPRGIDNSSGGQAYISSDRWGPLRGSLLHFSHGTGTAMQVLLDEVEGQVQGAFMMIPGEFRSGIHRGRFSPVDGQLYVAGMNGWGSYAPDHGCLQRVRYDGRPLLRPVGFHVHENGIALRFDQPVGRLAQDERSLLDRANYLVQAWNYRYSANYGSTEYSTRHYGVHGHDRLDVKSLQLLDEGRTLFVEIPELQAVNQLHIHAMWDARPFDLYATVHRMDRPRSDWEGYRQVAKTRQPHPLEIDLANALKRQPNPWRKKIKEAREITIEAAQNLSYSTNQIQVRPGEAISLTFINPDVVPHNWALASPGSLQRVGEMVNRLIGDPEAAYRQYIPQSNDILVYTDIIEGNDRGTIHFKAPDKPGRYPFLCTFPGHWMVMNGEMIVEP